MQIKSFPNDLIYFLSYKENNIQFTKKQNFCSSIPKNKIQQEVYEKMIGASIMSSWSNSHL